MSVPQTFWQHDTIAKTEQRDKEGEGEVSQPCHDGDDLVDRQKFKCVRVVMSTPKLNSRRFFQHASVDGRKDSREEV